MIDIVIFIINYTTQRKVSSKNELPVWGSIRYKHDAYFVTFILWKPERVLPHIELQKGCIVPKEKTSLGRVSVAATWRTEPKSQRSVPWILTVPRGLTSITNSSRDFIHVLLATGTALLGTVSDCSITKSSIRPKLCSSFGKKRNVAA
jgi:hypothetical protein